MRDPRGSRNMRLSAKALDTHQFVPAQHTLHSYVHATHSRSSAHQPGKSRGVLLVIPVGLGMQNQAKRTRYSNKFLTIRISLLSSGTSTFLRVSLGRNDLHGYARAMRLTHARDRLDASLCCP
eukprot:6061907-Amphidinium_carterae.1